MVTSLEIRPHVTWVAAWEMASRARPKESRDVAFRIRSSRQRSSEGPLCKLPKNCRSESHKPRIVMVMMSSSAG